MAHRMKLCDYRETSKWVFVEGVIYKKEADKFVGVYQRYCVKPSNWIQAKKDLADKKAKFPIWFEYELKKGEGAILKYIG